MHLQVQYDCSSRRANRLGEAKTPRLCPLSAAAHPSCLGRPGKPSPRGGSEVDKEDFPCNRNISLMHPQIYKRLFSFRKRKRRSDVVVVRGRLRLYSASGFFLLLGLVILAVGIGMATLGYWPQTMPSSKSQRIEGPKTSPYGGDTNATKMSSTAANFSTSDTVKGTAPFHRLSDREGATPLTFVTRSVCRHQAGSGCPHTVPGAAPSLGEDEDARTLHHGHWDFHLHLCQRHPSRKQRQGNKSKPGKILMKAFFILSHYISQRNERHTRCIHIHQHYMAGITRKSRFCQHPAATSPQSSTDHVYSVPIPCPSHPLVSSPTFPSGGVCGKYAQKSTRTHLIDPNSRADDHTA